MSRRSATGISAVSISSPSADGEPRPRTEIERFGQRSIEECSAARNSPTSISDRYQMARNESAKWFVHAPIVEEPGDGRMENRTFSLQHPLRSGEGSEAPQT